MANNPEENYAWVGDANDDDNAPDAEVEPGGVAPEMSEITREEALTMIGKVWAGNAGDELFRLFESGDYKAAFDMAKAKVDEQDRLNSLDERHDMSVYVGRSAEHPSRYVSIFFPDLGNMTITYETRPGNNGKKRPVVSVDFDVKKIDIIDAYGGDREIG